MPSGQGLAVVDVSVRFGGINALTHVSLQLSPGEIVGVIGPNGAGKTTLFNAICGFVKPSSGYLELRGKRVKIRPHRLRAHGIGRTLQGVGLWPGLTVLENVLVGAGASPWMRFPFALAGTGPSYREERALVARGLDLLEELGLSEHALQLPAVLSYALQKRAALARALMADPTFLLLDEPASGLSEAEMGDLTERLQNLRASKGVLLVEHHMDLVMSVSDRIVVLDFGEVIASGPPAAIRGDPAVTTAYLGEAVASGESHDASRINGGRVNEVRGNESRMS